MHAPLQVRRALDSGRHPPDHDGIMFGVAKFSDELVQAAVGGSRRCLEELLTALVQISRPAASMLLMRALRVLREQMAGSSTVENDHDTAART